MAGNKEKSENELDLNDKEVRDILHDEKQSHQEAIKTGVLTGLIASATVGLQTIFITPDFKKAFKQTDSSKNFANRLIETGKNNKFLSMLMAAPLIVAPIAGVIGYFITKSTIKEKQKELAKIEQEETKSLSSQTTSNLENKDSQNQQKWADRIKAQNHTMAIQR